MFVLQADAAINNAQEHIQVLDDLEAEVEGLEGKLSTVILSTTYPSVSYYTILTHTLCGYTSVLYGIQSMGTPYTSL